ncbi:MAG: hypothetical protein CMB80_12265 [Flammeovirgaceae bacterium]|nr:hypothetical protein [Flammeovirgaceae bacterium]
MSLTLPSVYSAAAQTGNIQENWLFQLYYDASNFVGVAFTDTRVTSVNYYGVVTNKPNIRSSIDLANSTAKTGNVSITLANFRYNNDDFSAELWGTRKYINRNVKIYSQLNANATLTNCLQIYQGRLIDISHDADTITLSVTEQRPWDFTTIPQDKTAATQSSVAKNVYIPVVYGAYTPNANTHGGQGYAVSKAVWPMPNVTDTGDLVLGMPFQTLDGTGGTKEARLHIYEKGPDIFPAISSADGGTSFNDSTKAFDGQHVAYNLNEMYRGFTTKPIRRRADDDSDGGNAIDSPLAHDASTSRSRLQHVMEVLGASGSDTEYFRFDCPAVSGKVTVFSMTVRYTLITAGTGHYNPAGANVGFSYAFSNTTVIGAATRSDSIQSHTNPGTTATTTSSTINMSTDVANNGYKLPDYIELKSHINEPASIYSGTVTATVDLYDIRLYIKAEDVYDDGKGSKEKAQEIKLFCGADGYSNSFSGGSGTADTGLEMHRDLLARFTNYDAADNAIYNWDTSLPSSGSLNVESLRITTAWNTRWWALEPVELKKVLEQVQKEFCFIFKWRADGSGSYWFVKDSYSSGDVTQTLNMNDINKLKISNTPFSELLTKMKIAYEKHPARNAHLSSVTSEDTTNNPRTTWNIQSKENISDVKLDMNVNKPGNADPGGGDANDGFADYYMNIFGDIKKIITCTIVNPAKGYGLETGDIIQFSNTAGEMPVEPFNDNWADYYMVIDLQRYAGGTVSITAREVS